MSRERLPLTPEPDKREFTVTGLPYPIVYKAAADAVTVLAVFYGARDRARELAERHREVSRQ